MAQVPDFLDFRGPADDVILEEVIATLTLADGNVVNLFTAKNIKWSVNAEKKLKFGAGYRANPTGVGQRRVERHVPVYEFTLEFDQPNMALLSDPGQFQDGQGAVTTMTVGGNVYTRLVDLPPFALTFQQPDQAGTYIVRKLFACEFSKDEGDMKLGDATGRTLSGFATDGQGLI